MEEKRWVIDDSSRNEIRKRAYEYAAELMASTGTMAEPQERMRAFVEKRKPVLNKNEEMGTDLFLQQGTRPG